MKPSSVVIVALGLTACHRTHHAPTDRCLALPAAVRGSLTAGPDGETLYWIERTRAYDYDANLAATWRLMSYDLRTERATVVLDTAAAPIRFIGGQLIALQGTQPFRLVLVADDRHVQELTPETLDVQDLEVVDAHTLALLADGDGGRAVYILDFNELRPYRLADADTLLSSSSGRVFVQLEDDIVAIDIKTRATSHTPYVKKSQPLGEWIYYVDQGTVIAQNIESSAPKQVITTKRAWKLVHQADGVLARTPQVDDKSYAYLLSGDTATPLPTMHGGTSILNTAQLGKRTWALIGHNTSNYQGDLAETDAETDICPLPQASEYSIASRIVPERFAGRSEALYAELAETAKGATLGIVEANGEPTTVDIHLRNEPGGADLVTMQKRTRQIYDAITRSLNDREIRTEVTFSDRRTGVWRWRRDRLHDRVSVGMGDALVSDSQDFELELSQVHNEVRDGKLSCKGTLHNLTTHAIVDVDVKCGSSEAFKIEVGEVDAGATRTFDQTFDVGEDDKPTANIDVLIAGKQTEPRSTAYEDIELAIFKLAASIYDDTGLWLIAHDVGDSEIAVTLGADKSFADLDAAAQDAKVKVAYERYLGLRKIYDARADEPIRIHVDVELTDHTVDYDGSRLVHDD